MAEAYTKTANRLLTNLSADALSVIGPFLEESALEHRQYISRAGERIEHVYFVERGLLSVVAPGGNGRQAEVGLVGFEGMSGVPTLLGLESWPFETFVQRPGGALRIRREDFLDAVEAHEELKNTFLKFMHVMLVQTAYTAFANAHGKLEERLARWLLMYHDRIDGDEMPLVHEFLAVMLAVRRPGVTDALHILEGNGLIKATRGKVTVINRAGLVDKAGAYYGQPEAEYAAIFAKKNGQ